MALLMSELYSAPMESVPDVATVILAIGIRAIAAASSAADRIVIAEEPTSAPRSEPRQRCRPGGQTVRRRLHIGNCSGCILGRSMLNYGYDPHLSEGAVKPPVFLTSTRLQDRR